MWLKYAVENKPESLNLNNPQDLNNKNVSLEIKENIKQLSPNSPPQIITESITNKKIVLLHGRFEPQHNKMYYTLDNNKNSDVNGFKEWLKNHGLPENTPYIACDGGKVTFDSNRGTLNPLIKNQFPIDVGTITNQEGHNSLIIQKSK